MPGPKRESPVQRAIGQSCNMAVVFRAQLYCCAFLFDRIMELDRWGIFISGTRLWELPMSSQLKSARRK